MLNITPFLPQNLQPFYLAITEIDIPLNSAIVTMPVRLKLFIISVEMMKSQRPSSFKNHIPPLTILF